MLQVSEAQVEAHVTGLRRLLAAGSIGKRRAFLTAWVRRIEVHGTDLRIVYSFPWFPEGGEAANEPMGGGGGGVVALDAQREKRGRSPRTPKAEPGVTQVLPMVVNGSPLLSLDKLAAPRVNGWSGCRCGWSQSECEGRGGRARARVSPERGHGGGGSSWKTASTRAGPRWLGPRESAGRR